MIEKIVEKRKQIRKKRGMFIFIYGLLFLVEICYSPKTINAASYTNAYAFYEENGNIMKFVPSTSTDGNIYYATKGKKGYNVSTLYSTIGWKVSVKHNNGNVLQTMYFQLGGTYMQTVDTSEQKGYEYSLYSVRLDSIKGRMNSTSKEALEKGKCTLVFDACIAVKKNGKLQGTMNDNGVTSGTVHMTYNGIAKAAPWSSATKTALAGYYNRSVVGLFSTLTLTKDEGIASVNGAGKYCYGTAITINATPLEGYTFAGWSGNDSYASAKTTITMGKSDISLKATSKLSSLLVTYFQNTYANDVKTEQEIFLYSGNPQNFQDFGWKREGYYQIGWALKRQSLKADYAITNTVSNKWILKHLPSINLYAVWNVNQYNIIFDANGGNGVMEKIVSDYESEIMLPQNTFTYDNGIFLGWSMNPLDRIPAYTASQNINIKELAKNAKVEYSNQAEIKLYAIWDNTPAITAENIYVSLQEARAGNITELLLASYTKATDKEDGMIPYGNHEQNSFLIEDYEASRFLKLEQETQITLTFCAKDSSGNICRREIIVFVVDTNLYQEKEIKGNVRFISKKYYKDEHGNFVTEEHGGLQKDSIWRTDEYKTILDILFLE